MYKISQNDDMRTWVDSLWSQTPLLFLNHIFKILQCFYIFLKTILNVNPFMHIHDFFFTFINILTSLIIFLFFLTILSLSLIRTHQFPNLKMFKTSQDNYMHCTIHQSTLCGLKHLFFLNHNFKILRFFLKFIKNIFKC